MSHFVYDAVALDFPKSDLRSLAAQGIAASKGFDSGDYNEVCQALEDLRDLGQNAKYIGFDSNAADPAPAGLDSYLWMKSDSTLNVKRVDAAAGVLVQAAAALTPGSYTTINLTVNAAGQISAIATGVSGVTLDGAYDFGGAHVGRTINVDASFPVLLQCSAIAALTTAAAVALSLKSEAYTVASVNSPILALLGSAVGPVDIGISIQARPINATTVDLYFGIYRLGSPFQATLLRYDDANSNWVYAANHVITLSGTGHLVSPSVTVGASGLQTASNVMNFVSRATGAQTGFTFDTPSGQDADALFLDMTDSSSGNGGIAVTNRGGLIFYAGQSTSVSSAGKGKLRYNNTTKKFQASPNALTYADLLTGAVVDKTADESVASSTTLQDDDHLLFAIGASERWEAEFSLDVGAALATTGIKLAVTVPASAVVNITAEVVPDNTSILATGVFYRRTTSGGTALDFTAATLPSVANARIVVRAWVNNSTNAGNVVLQFAQSTSDAANVTLRKGSTVVARRIA